MPSASSRGSIVAGSIGSSIAAMNRSCLVPKKWCTSAGSTAAARPTPRIVVAS